MYGLVNRGVKEFAIDALGESEWRVIARRAGIEGLEFRDLEQYPDAITYSLVAQASERTGKSVASLLQAFGRYWILFTARSTYGDLLDGSDDLESFLFQLNSLHESVATSMPKLIPPSFGVEPSDSGLIVLYVSEREGLEPMVTGLLEGLLETFGLDGHVQRLDDSSYGERRFLIRADEQ